jgi:hypothetical protein
MRPSYPGGIAKFLPKQHTQSRSGPPEHAANMGRSIGVHGQFEVIRITLRARDQNAGLVLRRIKNRAGHGLRYALATDCCGLESQLALALA